MKKYSLYASVIVLLILFIGSTSCNKNKAAVTVLESCTTNATLNPVNNSCECNAGYVFMNDECVPASVACAENATYNMTADSCECDTGFMMVNQLCVPNNGTECPENATYNASTETCECNEGFMMQNDECVPEDNTTCPNNEFYDDISQQCECNQGYVRNTAGDCVFFNLSSLYGMYGVAQTCNTSGYNHYFIDAGELPNQPDFISIVGLFGVIEFSTLKYNEDKTGANFQEGEIIGGKSATGGIRWEVDEAGNVTNLFLDAEYDGESCSGPLDKVEAGDSPCGENASVVNLKCQCDEGYRRNPISEECVAFQIYGNYDTDQSCSGIGASEYPVTFQEDFFQFDPNFMAVTNLFQTGESIRCEYKQDFSGFTIAPDQFLNGGQLPGISIISGECNWTLQDDGSITNVVLSYQSDSGETCTANLTAQ